MTISSPRHNYQPETGLNQYLDELRNYPPLSREDEIEIVRLAQNGSSQAQEQLITANLRFVVSTALEYRGRGIPIGDLISEGNLGLIEALSRFDPEKGVRFISYAVWWIRQAILKAIQGASHVRLPANRFGDMDKLSQRSKKMMHELGRTPTLNEVAEDLDIPVKRAERALECSNYEIAIDMPLQGDDEDDYTWELACSAPTPDAEMLETEQTTLIENILSEHLTEREMQVIRAYFDFDCDGSQNLSQIANCLGISRERARQIRNSALTKLEQVEELRTII